MLKTIIIKELQNNLYSLRFQISFFLIIGMFITSSIAFIKNYDTKAQEYSKYKAEFKKDLKETAESNAGQLAVSKRYLTLGPRGNSIISDCKEKYFPNQFEYNAYNVFGFEVGRGGTNHWEYPLLDLSDVPRYQLQRPDMVADLKKALSKLAALIIISIVLFYLSFLSFVKYDVR